MTDKEIKDLAYAPILEAWQVIHMTQNLAQDDDKGWKEYEKAHDAFCRKYENDYGHYLGMAIMAVVDDISKLNKEVKRVEGEM